MGEAINIVLDLQERAAAARGTLTNLEVSQELYALLCAECFPKTPSEFFGIPIEPLKNEPTLH